MPSPPGLLVPASRAEKARAVGRGRLTPAAPAATVPARGGSGSRRTLITRRIVAVAPRSSVTRSTMNFSPGVAKEVLVAGDRPPFVSKLPSPSRSHSKRASGPSGSLDSEPSSRTAWPTTGTAGTTEKRAVGGRFGAPASITVRVLSSTDPPRTESATLSLIL